MKASTNSTPRLTHDAEICLGHPDFQGLLYTGFTQVSKDDRSNLNALVLTLAMDLTNTPLTTTAEAGSANCSSTT